MDLLGNDSEGEVDFTINEDYAKRYTKWRRGEEIQKLKDKYGDVDDSESSTSEEEDEDGVELTDDVEKQFYKTLSCLKERNPKIYDPNVRFFEPRETQNGDGVVKAKKPKEETLTLAGYQRKVLLETGGEFSDSEEGEGEEKKRPFELMSSQEQENDIKQSFRDVLKDSDDEGEDNGNWGNLFTKRVKTAEELEKEEEDYKQWLAGENEKLKNEKVEQELRGLRDFWADPKLDEGEKFLRDYILNKRYLDGESKGRIPTYDEIVHDSDEGLSADEETVNRQDEFEQKYNFRFEEPDREFIKRYPRTMEQSMRKKDDRRKKHREEVKMRKEAERSKKDEELKRLKALKRNEILEKIKKLQQITGNEDMAFEAGDLEEDFDPDAHDRRMSEIFDENYYKTGGEDEEKPEFPDHDRELGIENWDEWNGDEEEEAEELHCEDPGFNMDCDYDPSKKKELESELMENSRRRKRRKKSKFTECLAKKKPIFDPNDKTFEEYVDEYYALDYEDLIGDIPCRFKYRKVVPNDFGLSIEEILNATDQELNRWVSIKKIVKRRPEHVEMYDVKAYQRKGSNLRQKMKFFPSLYGPKAEGVNESQHVVGNVVEDTGVRGKVTEDSVSAVEVRGTEELPADANAEEEEEEEEKKKRKRKRKRKGGEGEAKVTEEPPKKKANVSEKGKAEEAVVGGETKAAAAAAGGEEPKKKKKKKKKAGTGQGGGEVVRTAENIAANGSEKKKKKKNIAGTGQEGGEVVKTAENVAVSGSEKKKKKKKKSAGTGQGGGEVVKTAENVAVNGSEKKKKKKKTATGQGAGELVKAPENAVINDSEKKKKKKNKKGEKVDGGKVENQGKKRKRNASGDGSFPEKSELGSHKKRKFNSVNDKGGGGGGGGDSCNMSDERLRSYGINPKKYRNKLKYKKS